MTKRLSGSLGSYLERDEFQIGTMLVWVKYPSNKDRLSRWQRAEEILPVLESDVSRVEELATARAGCAVPATVIVITIEADGSAAYECTVFDGEHEDEFISIIREPGGDLVAARSYHDMVPAMNTLLCVKLGYL